MKNKQKSNSIPLLTYGVGIFLLLILIFLVFGLSLPDQISKKIVLTVDTPSQQVWERLSDNNYQLLWRTNLINIEKIQSPGSKQRYKETFKDDSTSLFEVMENEPGKKIVKKYIKGPNKGSSFTIIVLPVNENRSDAILISSKAVDNPFERVLYKTGVLRKEKTFQPLEDLSSMFTNHLKSKVKI